MKKYHSPMAEVTLLQTIDVLTKSKGDKNKDSKEVRYKRKFLLTKNELYFYKELKKIADKLNLTILSKIRMADLIEPAKDKDNNYYTAFQKIKSKHIDFALCDPSNLYVLLLIEVDDNSHKEQSKERDMFVEKVYQETGYKLLRVYGTADLEKKITDLLGQTQKDA